jgi:hypothetical protein
MESKSSVGRMYLGEIVFKLRPNLVFSWNAFVDYMKLTCGEWFDGPEKEMDLEYVLVYGGRPSHLPKSLFTLFAFHPITDTVL